MREMTVREMLAGFDGAAVRGNLDRAVSGIAYDSREVKPGFLFVAMDGIHTDGHRFIADALRRGAGSVLLSRFPEETGPEVTWIQVDNPRTALSPIAATFHRHPSRELAVIGVTGTDGKSSTVSFIAQLLGLLGRKAGFLSTVSFMTGGTVVKNPFRQSTPEASEIHGMLRGMADIGTELAVVEATSHGLSARMNRLGDVQFDAAVLTNVTHEHLEFHGSWEQYRHDKANLFRAVGKGPAKKGGWPRFGVVNADEQSAGYFRDACPCPVRTYGMKTAADLSARVRSAGITGTDFEMTHGGKTAAARIAIPGPFWVENALGACLVVAGILQIDPLSLAPLVGKLASVTGRMDYVDRGQPFAVIVDYAHTPGAFGKLLPWAREHTRGKLVAVFGSAGERDPAKRRMQGEVASRWCHTLVLTDEDPRGEDRMLIIEQIAEGCPGRTKGEDLFIIPDRREAVRRAVALAGPGDTVLLLGKGHEGSIIGPTGPGPWNERAEAEAALAAAGYGG
jgi:UDP-N-acetylmuramoyl-L-alanyl-D-glutamate--2,6-diaminopimelate ligase